MSKNKIVNPRTQLYITGLITIVVSICTAWFMLSAFSSKKNPEDFKAFITITGLALSYLSVIIGAYSVIGKQSYDSRIEELYKKDTYQSLRKNLKDRDAFTQKQVDDAQREFNNDQEKIYAEFKYYYAFEDTAKAHVYLSIGLVALGGACQVFGAI